MVYLLGVLCAVLFVVNGILIMKIQGMRRAADDKKLTPDWAEIQM